MDHTHNTVIRKQFTSGVSSPGVQSFRDVTVFYLGDMKKLSKMIIHAAKKSYYHCTVCFKNISSSKKKKNFKFRFELW